MSSPEYLLLDGHPYAVIRRDYPEDRTHPCPFCGRRHMHGAADGHRIAHCSDDAHAEIVAGQVTLRRADGYVVVTTNR